MTEKDWGESFRQAIVEYRGREENRRRSELGAVGRVLEDSIQGQEPSWKNALTRLVISKVDRGELYRRVRHSKEYMNYYDAVMKQLGKDGHRRYQEGLKRGYYRT